VNNAAATARQIIAAAIGREIAIFFAAFFSRFERDLPSACGLEDFAGFAARLEILRREIFWSVRSALNKYRIGGGIFFGAFTRTGPLS